MEMPAFLGVIIGWLRAGYPEGVPDVDYIPLFALLGSQLSDGGWPLAKPDVHSWPDAATD